MLNTSDFHTNNLLPDSSDFDPSPSATVEDNFNEEKHIPFQTELSMSPLKDEHVSCSLYPDISFNSEQEYREFDAIFKAEIVDIPSLVKVIEIILRNGKEKANLSLLRRILEAYNCNDWEPYQFWDPECKYTRNLIATDNQNYTLMLLCWNTEKESPVHNHPQCECFVRCLQGEIQETRYAWPTLETEHLPLQLLDTSQSKPGDVTLMNDSLGLHKITNVGKIGAITFHLYFPPYKSCKLFLDCTGKESVSKVCYHTVFGNPTQ